MLTSFPLLPRYGWITIGDIQITLAESPETIPMRAGEDFPEHPVIEGKPRLQWTGSKLREITLRLPFHEMLADPDKRLKELMDAMGRHEALDLVIGSGQYLGSYKGKYVITDVVPVVNQSNTKGFPSQMVVDVTLKEWVEDVIFRMVRGLAIPDKGGAAAVAGKVAKATIQTEKITNKDGFSVEIVKQIVQVEKGLVSRKTPPAAGLVPPSRGSLL